jgi:phosphoribosylamine--glycine ligase
VLAARGYPENPEKGAPIELPAAIEDGVTIFHAGTAVSADGSLVVAGGRVFGVTGVGPDFKAAQERSRRAAEAIRFEGAVFRRDIGWREEARTRSAE